MATREEIEKAKRAGGIFASEVVEDSRLGGDGKVSIVELSGLELTKLEGKIGSVLPNGNYISKQDGFNGARWIAACCRDMDGGVIWCIDLVPDLESIAALPATLIDKLVRAARKVNGYGVAALADEVKN